MGQESSGRSLMSRVPEALAAALASALDEPEREAVLGDLRESGGGRWKAVSDLSGLVIRRQAGAWKDFELWLLIATLVVPLTFLLSAVSETVIGEGAVYTWMYVNNSDWELAKNAGFWYVLREAALGLSTDCVLVACWSFSAGFALGRLPRQFAPACQTALLVLLVVSQASAVPQRSTGFLMHAYGASPAPLADLDAPLTAIAFYRVFFPWIVFAALIVLPAILGGRQGRLPVLRHGKLRVLLVTAAIISLITLLVTLPEFELLSGGSGRQWFWRNRNGIGMLPIPAFWPVFYMVAIRLRQFRRTGRAAA